MSAHRCPTCGLKHNKPSPVYAMTNVAQAITFAIFQTFAALALDGWLSIALWAMVARNVIYLVIIVAGLSMLATENLRGEQS